MADLEAVLADVSYLMAMEKSKCTPAARASKKIILPDPRWVSTLLFINFFPFSSHQWAIGKKAIFFIEIAVYERYYGQQAHFMSLFHWFARCN